MGIKKRKIGVNFKNGLAIIYLWAPKAQKVRLIYGNAHQTVDLERQSFGYWHLETQDLKPGTNYQFEISTAAGSMLRPDPASLAQPEGVHSTSRAVDLGDYKFHAQNWNGLPLKDFVIYELHTGTFSEEGNFDGITEKLDHLKELGITAIELMPISAFPGERNWGYDGVFPFAVQESYGGSIGLQKLVDACHQKGLAVILDVVYNHLGPEGNYLSDFADYFTDKYQTPWGKAINFDDEHCHGVRNFFIENALMWLRDFRIDALRLDAVHAINDFGPVHILAELQAKVHQLNEFTGRQHHLIIECDLNDPKYITSIEKNGLGIDAQWIDEFHHALRVAAGQAKTGYYADFNGLKDLAKSYASAYVYDGNYSPERKKYFGKPATGKLGQQFIVFSQNHDQVGNRMLGERSAQLYSHEMQKLLVAAVMISPFIPLLFMGEEYGETSPFLYFVSHTEPELIEAVRKGRNQEFSAFHQGNAPDPQAIETFNQSKLKWDLLKSTQHQQLFKFYKDIIALRKSDIVLASLNRDHLKTEVLEDQECLLLHRWQGNGRLLAILNFSNEPQEINFPNHSHWEMLIDSTSPNYGGKEASQIKNYNNDILIVQPESVLIYRQAHA